MAGFPNVPNVPGVPPLLRNALNTGLGVITALTRDGIGVAARALTTQWGLFSTAGLPVLFADSCAAFDYRKEYSVSTFPLEEGGFESYNKVATPFDVRLTMVKGGSESERTAFLATVDRAVDSLSLYTAVTPEVSYPSVNAVSYSYRREARAGATLLIVEIGLTEIRETVTTAFTNTRQPEGQDTVNVGPVRPLEPTDAQALEIG